MDDGAEAGVEGSTVPRSASGPDHTVHATTDSRNALHHRAHSTVACARTGGIVYWILFIVEHDIHSQRFFVVCVFCVVFLS